MINFLICIHSYTHMCVFIHNTLNREKYKKMLGSFGKTLSLMNYNFYHDNSFKMWS